MPSSPDKDNWGIVPLHIRTISRVHLIWIHLLQKSLFCGKGGGTPFCLFPNPLLAQSTFLLFHFALSLRLNAAGLFFGSPLLPGLQLRNLAPWNQ